MEELYQQPSVNFEKFVKAIYEHLETLQETFDARSGPKLKKPNNRIQNPAFYFSQIVQALLH